MQIQTIQGPVRDLVHKWKKLRRCRKCGHIMFVVFSSDGTYFGAHLIFGLHEQFLEAESLWICNKCFGDKGEVGKPVKKKGRMGFSV